MLAALQSAKDAVVAAEHRREATRIVSPFGGVVGRVDVRSGEFAQAGQAAVLVTDLDHLQVETTDLSELDLLNVAVGQPVTVDVEALGAQAPGMLLRSRRLPRLLAGTWSIRSLSPWTRSPKACGPACRSLWRLARCPRQPSLAWRRRSAPRWVRRVRFAGTRWPGFNREACKCSVLESGPDRVPEDKSGRRSTGQGRFLARQSRSDTLPRQSGSPDAHAPTCGPHAPWTYPREGDHPRQLTWVPASSRREWARWRLAPGPRRWGQRGFLDQRSVRPRSNDDKAWHSAGRTDRQTATAGHVRAATLRGRGPVQLALAAASAWEERGLSGPGR